MCIPNLNQTDLDCRFCSINSLGVRPLVTLALCIECAPHTHVPLCSNRSVLTTTPSLRTKFALSCTLSPASCLSCISSVRAPLPRLTSRSFVVSAGLLFTLKTHSEIFEAPEGAKGEGACTVQCVGSPILTRRTAGHDAPEWSKTVCIVILVLSTLLLAMVSEELVEAIQPTLNALGLPEGFLGVSILAVVPSTVRTHRTRLALTHRAQAEYVNAIGFALQNNVALSIEIGSSGSVQIALLQVPILVFFSAFSNHLCVLPTDCDP